MIGGGRPKVLGVPLDRKLLIGLFYKGDKINTWKVNAKNKTSIMGLTLECPKDEMLLINYEAPNGKKLHNRLWNGRTS